MTFIIYRRNNHKGQRGADKRGRDRRHNTLSKPKASGRAGAGKLRQQQGGNVDIQERDTKNIMSQVCFWSDLPGGAAGTLQLLFIIFSKLHSTESSSLYLRYILPLPQVNNVNSVTIWDDKWLAIRRHYMKSLGTNVTAKRWRGLAASGRH